ncbi:uncharacterized protein LOC117345400 [Pecten maximus]|uniref:uncharacterized protein LOC117345400 n=1 Tax=Pecten maximus TaxID=6579 RepID=UPI0014585073|nr:uncharacterized protein LOC117345400 [Pecten maximus]
MDALRLLVTFAVVVCIVTAQRPRGMGSNAGSTLDPRLSTSMGAGMGTGRGPKTANPSSGMGNRLLMMSVLRQQEMLMPYIMCKSCLEYSPFYACVMMEMCTFAN